MDWHLLSPACQHTLPVEAEVAYDLPPPRFCVVVEAAAVQVAQ
jgi:hypothetical protein